VIIETTIGTQFVTSEGTGLAPSVPRIHSKPNLACVNLAFLFLLEASEDLPLLIPERSMSRSRMERERDEGVRRRRRQLEKKERRVINGHGAGGL
jgi:hypothetical protein